MIPSLLICAVAVQEVFYSPGGSDYALAKSLAMHFHRPAAVMASAPDVRWPIVRVAYPVGKISEFEKSLRKKLGTEGPSEGVLSIARPSWPDWFFFVANRTRALSSFPKAGFDVTAIDKKVTVQTRLGPVALGTILAKLPSRPACHWYFRDAMVACSADSAAEADLLTALAGAVGAVAVLEHGRWSINLDPRAYRRRAVALLADMAASGRFADFRLDYRFTKEVLLWLENDQIAECLAAPGARGKFEASKAKGVQEAASARLRYIYPIDPDDGVKRSESVLSNWKAISTWFDWSTSYKVEYSPSGLAIAIYHGLQGRGDFHL